MNEILNKLKQIDSEETKKAFIELLNDYITPAFGSMSKRDFDILLFMKLQKLGVFDKNPELYELVSQLRVTRAKARNLLYESKLRQTTTDELDYELREFLIHPIFLKENDKIGIEIGNPFLIDHLRSKLKQLGHITDGSFSPELVKLTTNAYCALFESYLPDESKKNIKKAFVAIGAEADTSFGGILRGIIKGIGKRVASDAGSQIADNAGALITPLIDGSFERVKDLMKGLFDDI